MVRSPKIIPIILSGGFGSRLWPLSRESFPKQYQPLIKNNSKSLLQITQERIAKIDNISKPIIICNEEHRFIVAEQMREINEKPLSIILEPISKNTGPAITVAAIKSIEKGDDPLLLFLSADHIIKDNKKFNEAINKAIEYAENGKLITFGIVPSYPETGYGYIESIKSVDNKKLKGYQIKSFVEKPNLNKARELIKDKNFFWNSGIFLFKASTILSEINRYSPKLISTCKKALEKKDYDLDFQRLDKKEFELCEKISIDFLVLEKTKLGFVLPLDVGWSDIGSWKSLWEIEEKNIDGNVISGNIISRKSKDCYFRSENKLLVCLGLSNIIIVETKDATLIAQKDISLELKNVVEYLNKKDYPEGKMHKKIYRPWGYFISIEEDLKWQIKKLVVNPGASLSLQMHHHRAEHWVVLKGIAKVEINSETNYLEANQSIYIPLGSKHRLSNPKEFPLTLIEVQSGEYLGEDDIVRFEDIYGRKEASKKTK